MRYDNLEDLLTLAEGFAFDDDLLEEANGSGYDLKARFDHWNKLAFGGSLPEVPLKWCKSRRYSGMCKYYIRNGVIERPSIEISNLYDRDEAGFDAIMLHEMIHLFFTVEFPTEREHSRRLDRGGHGTLFEKKAEELSKKTGIKISVTDDLKDAVAPEKTSKLGVLIFYDKDDSKFFRLISFPAKNLFTVDAKAIAFRQNLLRMVNRYKVLDIKLGYSDDFVFSHYKVLKADKSYIVNMLNAVNCSAIYKALDSIADFDPKQIEDQKFYETFVESGYKVPS